MDVLGIKKRVEKVRWGRGQEWVWPREREPSEHFSMFCEDREGRGGRMRAQSPRGAVLVPQACIQHSL